jgi:hypothetical protein
MEKETNNSENIEITEKTQDWKMSVKDFEKNGCLVNGD